jgi:hypothetical protein
MKHTLNDPCDVESRDSLLHMTLAHATSSCAKARARKVISGPTPECRTQSLNTTISDSMRRPIVDHDAAAPAELTRRLSGYFGSGKARRASQLLVIPALDQHARPTRVPYSMIAPPFPMRMPVISAVKPAENQ